MNCTNDFYICTGSPNICTNAIYLCTDAPNICTNVIYICTKSLNICTDDACTSPRRDFCTTLGSGCLGTALPFSVTQTQSPKPGSVMAA